MCEGDRELSRMEQGETSLYLTNDFSYSAPSDQNKASEEPNKALKTSHHILTIEAFERKGGPKTKPAT